MNLASIGALIFTLFGVAYLVLYVIDAALDFFQFPMAEQIKFVLSVVSLIIILGLAARALTSGGLGFFNFGDFGQVRRSQLGPDGRPIGLAADGGISYIPRQPAK